MIITQKSLLKELLFFQYKQYLNTFANAISGIDVIEDNIWTYLCCPNVENTLNDEIKLYYEVKNRNTWDTSMKSKSISYDSFMMGFIYCVFDKYTKGNRNLVPSFRNDLYYFINDKSQTKFIHSSLKYCFALLLTMINEIQDVLLQQHKHINCSVHNNLFYNINYYNKDCALDHYFNNLLRNIPVLLAQ